MPAAPHVDRIEWGKLTVARGLVYRDAKLWPGGSCEWDWRVTGTRHLPGILPADLTDLLACDVETAVLSRGQDLVLLTQPEAFGLLRSRGVAVVHAESREAVARYNELAAAGRQGDMRASLGDLDVGLELLRRRDRRPPRDGWRLT